MKKKAVKLFTAIAVLIVLIISVSAVFHSIKLRSENKKITVIGNLTEVNGHMMNVYTAGEGEHTLVFLSGGGTCSPVLDFKSLYSQLEGDYCIAVVEKAGYGFSDVSDISRDIDTVLSETRQALSQSGLEAPYVLCPHSMSGIEALYWAQKYPEEVEAIVGLDMSVPQAYEDYEINMPLLRLGQFAAKIGLLRFIPSAAESEAIKYGTLTDEEKELYRMIFSRRTATDSMLNEVGNIKESAKKVNEGGIPQIPMIMFSSNGSGTGWDETSWREFQKEYSAACGASLIELDCPHYVHDHEYVKISDEIRSFIENADK